jgi:cystathionine gamma-lyase
MPGRNRMKPQGAIMTPIYASSTFVQQSPGVHKGYDYSRSGNPTRTALESCMASLEDGRWGFAFASGLAAENAILDTLEAGSHIIAMEDMYGGTFRLFDKVRKFSAALEVTYLDLNNEQELEKFDKGEHPADLGGDTYQPDAHHC